MSFTTEKEYNNAQKFFNISINKNETKICPSDSPINLAAK